MNKNSTTTNHKILILTLSSKTYPSSRNKKQIKKTWGSNLEDNFKIIFYESGETEKLIDDTLFVETDTSSKNLGYKLLLALDWCTRNIDYDFIFRTNTSSFVNTIELENFISNNLSNKEHVYCGMPLVRDYKDSDKKIDFLSGAGIILNKKTTQLILDKKKDWDHSEWEDVSLGKLLHDNGVSITNGKRQDIQNNFYNNIIDKDNYHYRCRLDNHYGYPRFLEKYVFADLNKILKNEYLTKVEIFVKKNVFFFLKTFRVESPRFKIYKVMKILIKTILPTQIFEYLKKRQPVFLKKFINERI